MMKRRDFRRRKLTSVRNGKRPPRFSSFTLARRLAVEVLEGRLLLAADFGDAPDPYPTLLADNGARHEIGGPIMGTAADAELNGFPSPGASGDDINGVDDEDGVTFGALRVGQVDAVATVNVALAPAGAYVDAWIDFNGDGLWSDANERIAYRTLVVEGANTIAFHVPPSALSGATYARFRVSSAGGLGPVGLANDGEVEDYLVEIAPPRSSAGVFGPGNEVSYSAAHGNLTDLIAADVDGDGDQDMISLNNWSQISWHENLGDGFFQAHELVSLERGAEMLSWGDVNGDGHNDLVFSYISIDAPVWYENDGQLNFTKHEILPYYSSPAILELADLDSDDDLDLIYGGNGNEIGWFENDGTGVFAYHVLTNSAIGVEDVVVSDVDGDGDMDLATSYLLPATPGYAVIWLENDGSQAFTVHTVADSLANKANPVVAIDLDGDEDVDFVSASRYLDGVLLWHENDGNENFTTRVIDANAQTGLKLVIEDLDDDGDLDIVAMSTHFDLLYWYENDGAESFTRHKLPTQFNGLVGLAVLDIDQDEKLDIATSSGDDYVLTQYRQLPGGQFEMEIFGAAVGLLGATTADLDGDGDVDIVGALNQANYTIANGLVWQENVGEGRFRTWFIEVSLNYLQQCWVVDMEGDGDQDILVHSSSDAIYWFENNGLEQFTRRVITTSAVRVAELNPIDYDGDGDLDIVTGGGSTARTISLYRNNGSQGFAKQTLLNNVPYAIHVAAGDMDRDGDVDFLASGGSGTGLGWYENLGGFFAVHTIDSQVNFAENVLLADIDSDGDLDALTTSSYSREILLYENDGAQNFVRRIVTDQAEIAARLEVYDLDGDGDLDILSLETGLGNFPTFLSNVAWYENEGGANFTRHLIVEGWAAVSSATAGDLDGDGDLDLVIADPIYRRTYWYENTPSIELSVDAYQLDEEVEGGATITISRGGDSGGELAATFTVAGDGVYGADYTILGAASFDGTTGTVIFPAGVDRIELAVVALDDDLVEEIESLQLVVDVPPGYLAGSTLVATLVLVSGDFLGDYGDAPAPYPTLQADNGARHLAVGPKLGATRDEELDGTPTAGAIGDGDEDGVTITPIRGGQVVAEWVVNVEDAPEGAMLDAWIDFNGDGSWDFATEQVAASLPVVAGDNVLRFEVPTDAAAGATYARFRLSTSGGLAPRGEAADGEVEDYAVTILPAVASGGVFLPPEVIAEGVSDVLDVVPVDFDRDGDLDLVAALSTGDEIVWFENQGDAGYARHSIVAEVDFVGEVSVIDFDFDGDLDVITRIANPTEIRLYENQGDQTFAGRTLATGIVSLLYSDPADLDQDGDLDILGQRSAGAELVWLENDGSGNFTEHSIATAVFGASLADFDHDGDLDIIAVRNTGVSWFVNFGGGQFLPRSIGSLASPASAVSVADVDGDGDFDVLASSNALNAQSIVWFENNGLFDFTQRLVGTAVTGARHLKAVDLDGDGDLDVLPIENSLRTVRWFENVGGAAFTERILSTTLGQTSAGAVGDFNGDGDLDIVVATSDNDRLTLLQATTAVNVSVSPASVSEQSAAPLRYRFERAGYLAAPLSVDFTVGGIATFAVDYTVSGAVSWDGTNGSVIFEPGVSTVEVLVTSLDDTLLELGETVIVTLLPGEDYAPGLSAQAVGTIVSNEFGGDFGDAPAPYPTTLADGGAAHEVYGPRLGNTRDHETDGQPSVSASGDGADEDGVIWPAATVGQLDAEFQVDVQNAPDGARLDAWIDFDGDGTWNGPGEHVVVSAFVENGNHTIHYDVPAWARAGITYVRVRISTAGGLGPGGIAADGEVEDHVTLIQAGTNGDGVYVLGGAIATNVDSAGVSDLVPVDLDGDGDLDVVAATEFRDSIVWHENVGAQGYVPHVISNTIDGPVSATVADLDGDGDLDIVAVARNEDLIAWFVNDGEQNFTRLTIFVGADDPVRVMVADVDGDGRQDVVSLSAKDSSVRWHRQLATGEFTSTRIGTVNIPNATLRTLIANDIDRDGDLDIAFVSLGLPEQYQQFVWLENNGGGQFAQQTLFVVPASFAEAVAVDLDRDGDLDFAVASRQFSGDKLYWYENTGSGSYTQHPLGGPTQGVQEIEAGDLDGDGDVDLVVRILSGRGSFPGVTTYINNGAQQFTERANFGINATNIALADVDQDGDLDFLVGAGTGSSIVWYTNIAVDAGDFDGNGTVNGRDFLVWQRGFGITSGATRAQGDSDNDGDVDAQDLAAWRATYGWTAPVQLEAVGPVAAITAVEAEVPPTIEPAAAQADELPIGFVLSFPGMADTLAPTANEIVEPTADVVSADIEVETAATDIKLSRPDRAAEILMRVRDRVFENLEKEAAFCDEMVSELLSVSSTMRSRTRLANTGP